MPAPAAAEPTRRNVLGNAEMDAGGWPAAVQRLNQLSPWHRTYERARDELASARDLKLSPEYQSRLRRELDQASEPYDQR